MGTVSALSDLSETNRPAEAPGARMTKRQLQAVETKNKIYAAALREINEKGFGSVSIEDITTAANVAKGTFYTHFESKEALVLYTFTQSDEIYRQAYEQVAGLDFLEMVTRFVRISYTEYEKRGKGIIKAMISNYFTLPGYNFYGRDRSLLQCLGKIVESGKAEGALDAAAPTDWYVGMLLSTMVGVEVMWCFDEQERRLADMIQEAVRVTAAGLLRRA